MQFFSEEYMSYLNSPQRVVGQRVQTSVGNLGLDAAREAGRVLRSDTHSRNAALPAQVVSRKSEARLLTPVELRKPSARQLHHAVRI